MSFHNDKSNGWKLSALMKEDHWTLKRIAHHDYNSFYTKLQSSKYKWSISSYVTKNPTEFHLAWHSLYYNLYIFIFILNGFEHFSFLTLGSSVCLKIFQAFRVCSAIFFNSSTNKTIVIYIILHICNNILNDSQIASW